MQFFAINTKHVHFFNINCRCPVCAKMYSTLNRLLAHHKKEHPNAVAITCSRKDSVLLYTISLVTLGLLRQTLHTAIKHANGELIFSLYR